MAQMKYSDGYVAEVVSTDLAKSGEISRVEFSRIEESIRINGLAVINGFFDDFQLQELVRQGVGSVQPDFDAGPSLGAISPAKTSTITNEFGHPFLVSKMAAKLVTNAAIVNVVEAYLGGSAIVHHALFQQSIPRATSAVDWHVDTGSNKVLNGTKRFPDKRLRMIVYLSDVTAGGLSYLLATREAAQYFLSLPEGALFPQEEVPLHEKRRIFSVKGKAGTVMFFDAHGLHKPDPPVDHRMVLNVWFARSDFSGDLPPSLVSLSSLSEVEMQRAYIFKNAKGFVAESGKKRVGNDESSISLIKKIFKNVKVSFFGE